MNIAKLLFDPKSQEAKKGIETLNAFKRKIVKPAVNTPVGKVVNAVLPIYDEKKNQMFPNSIAHKPLDPMNMAMMTGTVSPVKSIARLVNVNQLKLGQDFQTAMGDVLQGRKAVSKLPILATPDKNGIYNIVDGNHRLAEMMQNGIDKVEIITDEKAYRKLAKLEEQWLSKQKDAVKTAFTKYMKDAKGKFIGSKAVESPEITNSLVQKLKSVEHLSDNPKISRKSADIRPTFEQIVQKWTSGVDKDAKMTAYQLGKDNNLLRRDLLKEQFGDWKGQTEVYRVGNTKSDITSVFANKGAADAYAKRMGVNTVNPFIVAKDDLVPTMAGSGELLVNKNSLLSKIDDIKNSKK